MNISIHQYSKTQYGKTQSGFTIVELLISVALGLLLISGLVTAFVGSSRTSELNSTLTDMQESGRFALDSMTRDIRMAGFQGCANISSMPANVRANSAPTDNYAADSFRVFEVDSATNWSPAPHDSFNIPTDTGVPVPGTHAFSVQFGSPTTFAIAPMADSRASIVVTSNSLDLITGDVAIISDCSGADIFEISGDSGNSLQHDGNVNSGDDRLSAPYGQGNQSDRSRVMRFEANIYFIGDTGRLDADNKSIRSLYRQTLPYSQPPIEIAEGVENLRIRLGVEDLLNPGDITFVTPGNSLLNTHKVRSVQIGFLMQSYSSVSDQQDSRTYQIAGYEIPAGSESVTDGLTHASDRKMRLQFNGSVAIRNR